MKLVITTPAHQFTIECDDFTVNPNTGTLACFVEGQRKAVFVANGSYTMRDVTNICPPEPHLSRD